VLVPSSGCSRRDARSQQHRYVITVHVLDVEDIGISIDGTPAMLGFTMSSHILGRAILTGTAEMPAA
jgi:hypothetical protein